MVTTFYPPHNRGGDGIFVRNLSRELVSRGHSVEVVYNLDAYRTLGGEVEVHSDEGVDEGIRLHPLTSSTAPSLTGRLSTLLVHQTGSPAPLGNRLREILEQPFDAIHFHNISLIGGPGVLELGDAVKLYTTHEWWLVCPTHSLFKYDRAACEQPTCLTCTLAHRRPPQPWRYSGKLRRNLGAVDAFLAPSRFSEQMHRDRGLDLRFVSMPHFTPDCVGELDGNEEPNDTPYFLYVGRLERLKGAESLMSICGQLKGAELWIAGSGAEEDRLRAAADDLPVRFLGWRSGRDLARLYRDAVAVIVPSLCYEIFALVTIEALQQGTPILVRNRGALPEIASQSGGGIVYDDNQQLLAAMNDLLSDGDLCRRLGRRGRESQIQRWSAEAHLERYVGLIQELRNR
jgi:glycosyltransferase involved in cell wall biosynthesis